MAIRSWDSVLRRVGVGLTVGLYLTSLMMPMRANETALGSEVLVAGLLTGSGLDLVLSFPGRAILRQQGLANVILWVGLACLVMDRPLAAVLAGDAALLTAAFVPVELLLRPGISLRDLGLGPGYYLWVASTAILVAFAGALLVRRRLVRPEPADG